MGAYLAKPKTEKFSESNVNEKISYGVACMQGWRVTMEDAHTCLLDFDDNTSLFAVYDGHGGSEVAQYIAKHLPDVLRNTESFKTGEVKKSLVDAFLEVDNALITDEGLEELRQLAGCDKDVEEDIGMLEKEAMMPLQELLAKMKEMKKARNDNFEDEDKQFEEQWTKNDTHDCNALREKNDKPKESGEAKREDHHGEEKEKKKDDSCGQAASTETLKAEIKGSEEAGQGTKIEEEAPRKGETSCVKGTNNIFPNEGICNEEEGSDDDDDEDENSEEDHDDEDDDDDDDNDDDNDNDNDDDEQNEENFQTSDEVGYDSGTTAIVALVRDSELTVANVGDSRCVLCRNGIALEMSVDHKPEDKPELDRINKAGGKVTCEGRVNGGLNLSRALGDHSYKLQTELSAHEQQITAVPDVRQTEIKEADEFMVIACDGIWNVRGSQEVVNFVSDKLQKQRKNNGIDLKQICEELIDSCLAQDTSGDGSGCDNMTCIVVVFTSKSSVAESSSKKRKSQQEQLDCDLAADKRPRTEDV